MLLAYTPDASGVMSIAIASTVTDVVAFHDLVQMFLRNPGCLMINHGKILTFFCHPQHRAILNIIRQTTHNPFTTRL